jgi:hypothetical protein
MNDVTEQMEHANEIAEALANPAMASLVVDDVRYTKVVCMFVI